MAPPETQWFYLGERAIDVELQGKRCRIIGISNHHYVKVAGLGRTIIDMTYVSVISKYPNLSEQLLELMYEQGNLTREKKYEMIHHLFSHLEKYPDMLDHVKSLPIFQRISLEINKRPDQIKTLAGEEIKISIVFGGRRGFFLGMDIDGICLINLENQKYEVGLIPLLLENRRKAEDILYINKSSRHKIGGLNHMLVTELEELRDDPRARNLLKSTTLTRIKNSHRFKNGEYVAFEYEEEFENKGTAKSIKEALKTGKKITMSLRPLHNKIHLIS